MRLSDFFARVEADPMLEGVGLAPARCTAGPAVIVRHHPTGLITLIDLEGIVRLEWATLLSVISGEREPLVLQHFSRVVGYWSRIENWNRSKLG